MRELTVEIGEALSGPLLAPAGTFAPCAAVVSLEVTGGRVTRTLIEPELGLAACLIAPEDGSLALRYRVEGACAARPYPEAAFRPRANRYTVAAAELAEASREAAARAGGGRAGIEALVAEAEARFAYAHPDRRFNDGTEAVPYLACGATPGSCIDINTYLVASLRAAGYEAAYLYGYFFPEERGGVTEDMHCWVATRHEGETLDWDIAHHMKAGLGPTRPALNPRPGERVAIGHSMGQTYHVGATPLFAKLLAEPMRVTADGAELERLTIRARLSPDPARAEARAG